MDLVKKLKEPKNKLRYFSLTAYAILFAVWFALDFKILYLAIGLFIILAAKVLYAYQLSKSIKPSPKKKTKRKKKKS